jgi:hypothetical protein
LVIGAALLLSAFVLLAAPTLAHATEPVSSKAGVVIGLGAADTQPSSRIASQEGVGDDAPRSDDRDRRVLAALAFTVIGTIGLITIGSVVLLTQPGDRQVMVIQQAEPSETSRSGSFRDVE